jgi:hypothetical protein
MAKAVTSELIVLGTADAPGRFSFFRGFKPKAFRENQPARFECTLLLDPTNATHAAQLKSLNRVAKELVAKAGGDWVDFEEGLCYGSGDKGKKSKYAGYKGMYWVSSSSTVEKPPQIIDRGRNPLLVDANGREPKIPYSGAYGLLGITLWVQNNEWGKRVNANFKVAQFVKDGDPLSSVEVDVNQHFQALGDSPAAAGGDLDDGFLE